MSRVAFVQDNLIQAGGGERVAEEIMRAFPKADVFTSVYVASKLSDYIKGRRPRSTWMQHLPWITKFYRYYLLLYPLAIRSIDLSSYEIIVSSCYGSGKFAQKGKDAFHLCYCHNPTRWIWRGETYTNAEGFGKVKRFALAKLALLLRQRDRAAAQDVNVFLVNSRNVAAQIQAAYGKPSIVLHPPIRLENFLPTEEHDGYYLVVSRLISYKKIELAIQACQQTGRELYIIGEGPDRSRLESLSSGTTHFLGRLSDAEVCHFMARCRALLVTGEEDFGLTPLEVSAAGRPCIAYGKGGALETIIPGLNGLLFTEQEPTCLADAMRSAEHVQWSSTRMREHVATYNTDVFTKTLQAIVAGAERNCTSPSATEEYVEALLNGREDHA